MYICTAITGIDKPSRSRRSTSSSRELSASLSSATRRRERAFASVAAVNEEAATAEWRMAAALWGP